MSPSQQAAHIQARYEQALAHRADAQLPEALEVLVALRPVCPQSASIENTYALTLSELGRHEEALTALEAILAKDPPNRTARTNYPMALARAGRVQAALCASQLSLGFYPDCPTLHTNLGNLLRDARHFAGAHERFAEALRIDPDFTAARMGRGLCHLLLGDYELGWPDYEWRPGISFPRPLKKWAGAPLGVTPLVVHFDQGLGDAIQFSRYLPRLRGMSEEIYVVASSRLHALLQPTLAEARFVDRQPDVEDAEHICLCSLPGIFKTSFEAVPPPQGSVPRDEPLQSKWSERLRDFKGLRIGVSFTGNPRQPTNAQRSVAVERFEALAAVEGATLFSLQQGVPSHQQFDLGFPVIDLGPLDTDGRAFVETAAVLRTLDLVITIDSALAHLACTLGKRTWIALASTCDWRWGQDGETTPWYPTARLFRQEAPGDWDVVFERLQASLVRHVEDPEHTAPPSSRPSSPRRPSSSTLVLDLDSTPYAGTAASGIFERLLLDEDIDIVPMHPQAPILLDPASRAKLERGEQTRRGIEKLARSHSEGLLVIDNATLLVNALYPHEVRPPADRLCGGCGNYAHFAFEDTRFEPELVALLNTRYQGIIVASSWRADILRAAGVERVFVNRQAVDLDLFRPNRQRRDVGRFTVYSAGRFEFRNGQDIVIAALARFLKRHPEAHLILSWNHSGSRERRLAERLDPFVHVQSIPAPDEHGTVDFKSWLCAEHGFLDGQITQLPVLPQERRVPYIAQADVALFPNRCEGATNLDAMEAMACGVPCILSANTGHLDLMLEEACFPLRNQAPLAGAVGRSGWGESCVEETVELLSACAEQPERSVQVGARGREVIAGWTWRQHVDRLLEIVGHGVDA